MSQPSIRPIARLSSFMRGPFQREWNVFKDSQSKDKEESSGGFVKGGGSMDSFSHEESEAQGHIDDHLFCGLSGLVNRLISRFLT